MQNDKSDLISLLMGLGVARTDAITYKALLTIDSVSVRKIAAHTGINRGTTYEALKRLVALGLVSVKGSGKREYYTAESPEVVFNIIRDKRRDLLEAAAAAKKIVPTLLADSMRPAGKPLVRYYEDDEGVVAILKDVLQTCRALPNKEYYAYSSSAIRQYLYRKFPKFTERRIAEGIRVRVIAVGERGEDAALSERKWLIGSTGADLSSYTIIYGNKVATISIASDYTPYGVVIEDGGGAAMQRLLFEHLWKYMSDPASEWER